MQFTVLKEHLERALRYTAKATARQSTLPIIQNIAIIARDGALYCMATNLDVGVTGRLSGRTDGDGGIVVPPQLLQSFIAALDDGAQISCASSDTDGVITVTSGGVHAEMKGYDPGDFPIIPEKSPDLPTVVFGARAFVAAMTRVVGCVAKSEARPELTGVYIVCDGINARFVATDGFRLGESIVGIATVAAVPPSPVIVPYSAVVEVMAVVADTGCETVTVSYGDGQVFFACGDVMVVSRVITGNYPDYRQIVPRTQTATVKIGRMACEKAIRLADAFAVRSTSDMSLRVVPEEGGCVIGAASHDRGRNRTMIPAQIDGEQQEVFLNTRYTLDGIGQCGTDDVVLRFNGPAAPVVIEPDGVDGFLYLIMPIRR